MRVPLLCALLCATWCCESNPQVEQVTALKQQCVAVRRAEEDALRAVGLSASALHAACARWAWRQVR